MHKKTLASNNIIHWKNCDQQHQYNALKNCGQQHKTYLETVGSNTEQSCRKAVENFKVFQLNSVADNKARHITLKLSTLSFGEKVPNNSVMLWCCFNAPLYSKIIWSLSLTAKTCPTEVLRGIQRLSHVEGLAKKVAMHTGQLQGSYMGWSAK